MIKVPNHPKEESRLSALLRYEVLDSEDEAAFDELTQLAAYMCETPFALFNLIDDRRLWCKSRVGLDVHETGRDIAFCSHTILQDDIFEVQDALRDERFFDNPFVMNDPKLRFYAGIPLFSEEHLPIGTLCVLDPRAKALSPEQQNVLRVLSKQIVNQLETRLNNRRLQRITEQYDATLGMLAHDLTSPFNGILGCAKLLNEQSDDLSSDEVKEMAQGIYVSSLKVYQLLDELMRSVLCSMGASPGEQKNCNVSSMLDETMDFLKEAFSFKQLSLVNRLRRHLEISGDPAWVKTILRNIITNAIKHSPQGGSIFVEYGQVTGRMVEISITDEGRGFPLEEIRRQALASTEADSDSVGEVGHGLGLNLCRKLAEQQGGSIYIDPECRHGARVIMRMKRA